MIPLIPYQSKSMFFRVITSDIVISLECGRSKEVAFLLLLLGLLQPATHEARKSPDQFRIQFRRLHET